MKGKAKRKAVTSGRLTGATRGSRGTGDPGPAAQCGPTYSLYSTDSEDQVTTLHKGLDRCAALLGGMLQVDGAASLSPPRSVNPAATSKPKVPTFQVKKTVKKLPPKTGQRGPGSTTLRARGAPAVKLRPPLCSSPPPPPQPSPATSPAVLLSVHQSSSPASDDCRSQQGGDLVPVRDTQTSDRVPAARVHTVQFLLRELKALIAGQGSVTERLLSRLEHTISSPQFGMPVKNTPLLLSENVQLRKHVKMLNQQLKEREKEKVERPQSLETFSTSQVVSLQSELDTARFRLQELQDDVTQLRQQLQDTQSELRGRQAENTLIQTDLDVTRRRLAASERERSELALLAQRRLEETGELNRLLQTRTSSGGPDRPHHTEGPRQDPPAPPSDRIAVFLESLSQTEDGPTPTPTPTPTCSDVPSQHGDAPGTRPVRPADPDREGPPDAAPSETDVESAWSEWSLKTGSTFNTRDEAAFRDGLAALDASIASLQRTIQRDLRT